MVLQATVGEWRRALGIIGRTNGDRRLLTACNRMPMVRLHAARASVAFADPGVADALTKLLGDREWIVRAAARDALRSLGSLATSSVLRTLWQGDPFAANNAAEVLFLTGETVGLIRDALTSPDKPERTRFISRWGALSRIL